MRINRRPGYGTSPIGIVANHRFLFLFQVAEVKKVQCAGGTLQGESNPTWTKQPNDKFVNAAGFLLAGLGLTKATVAQYRLATGKGKIEE